ncbi:nuclear transport factor 2 family protein [Yaniella halotolerans]|uniref:nuclear transport factor 2 family protein n=1 Tax=Yaniella halotolerans TaxID=225453 RepID=UPI0003B3766C|nr:hypothetical protein [Yaniella halotolerans]
MTTTTERSKEIVLAFYEAYNQRDVEAAMSYIGDVYIQHNPWVPGESGRNIMDVFRVNDDGKIVEHWDVVQDIPKLIYPPINDNGYF